MKENFEILQKNISQFPNIKGLNIGLGANNGTFKVYPSDNDENYGGVSFFSEVEGSLNESFAECNVKNVNDVIEELGIPSVDLIKIDTEGAEYDILTSIKTEFLEKTSWITGELHGNRDFEVLNYLNDLDFSISMKKNIDNRLFMFNAGKEEIISQINRKEIS